MWLYFFSFKTGATSENVSSRYFTAVFCKPTCHNSKNCFSPKSFLFYPGAWIMDMSSIQKTKWWEQKIEIFVMQQKNERLFFYKAQKNIQLYELLSKRQFARKRRSLKFRLKSFAAISQFDQKISHYHWQFEKLLFFLTAPSTVCLPILSGCKVILCISWSK